MIARPVILHPALRRLWWQGLRGGTKRLAHLVATPIGILLSAGALFCAGLIFRDGLHLTRPWIETVDQSGILSLFSFALFLPFFVETGFTAWATSAPEALFNTPLPRKQILFYVLLRRVAFAAVLCLCGAPLLDSHHYLDLALRLASFAAFAVSGLTLLAFALERLPARARLGLEILSFLPLAAGVATSVAVLGLRFTDLERARSLAVFLAGLRLNEPFRALIHRVSAPGPDGAALVSAVFLAAAALSAAVLLRYFEASPEANGKRGLFERFRGKQEARPSRLPALPRTFGAGPLLRVQLLSLQKMELFSYPSVLFLPWLFMLSGSGSPEQLSYVLSMLLFSACFVGVISQVNRMTTVFFQLEKLKALPVDPLPLLAASLVVPTLAGVAVGIIGLAPIFLLFPAVAPALPTGKFLFTLVPLVFVVAASVQATMLTVKQQAQRLSMAKRWYQEMAYVVSLVLASLVFLFLTLLIVAPTLAWRETTGGTAALIATIQMAGAALVFWYARVSYRLIEVLHHND